mmetsp:Transcript_27644/g.63587  ORF Transcript_27644/g.63587 Transcript_27644/m.63587 type:complete len:124 (+) Transcript_27644:2-373(+)
MPVTLRSRGDGTPGKAAQSPSSKSTPSKAKPEATTSDAVDAAAEPGHLLNPKTTEFEFGGPLGAMAVGKRWCCSVSHSTCIYTSSPPASAHHLHIIYTSSSGLPAGPRVRARGQLRLELLHSL